jgi:hypothetical protein
MIAAVSLRLLYLIVSWLLSWLTLTQRRDGIRGNRATRPTPRGCRTPQNQPEASPRLGRPGPVRRLDPTPACAVARASLGPSGHSSAVAPSLVGQETDLPEPRRSPTIATTRSLR